MLITPTTSFGALWSKGTSDIQRQGVLGSGLLERRKEWFEQMWFRGLISPAVCWGRKESTVTWIGLAFEISEVPNRVFGGLLVGKPPGASKKLRSQPLNELGSWSKTPLKRRAETQVSFSFPPWGCLRWVSRNLAGVGEASPKVQHHRRTRGRRRTEEEKE